MAKDKKKDKKKEVKSVRARGAAPADEVQHRPKGAGKTPNAKKEKQKAKERKFSRNQLGQATAGRAKSSLAGFRPSAPKVETEGNFEGEEDVNQQGLYQKFLEWQAEQEGAVAEGAKPSMEQGMADAMSDPMAAFAQQAQAVKHFTALAQWHREFGKDPRMAFFADQMAKDIAGAPPDQALSLAMRAMDTPYHDAQYQRHQDTSWVRTGPGKFEQRHTPSAAGRPGWEPEGKPPGVSNMDYYNWAIQNPDKVSPDLLSEAQSQVRSVYGSAGMEHQISDDLNEIRDYGKINDFMNNPGNTSGLSVGNQLASAQQTPIWNRPQEDPNSYAAKKQARGSDQDGSYGRNVQSSQDGGDSFFERSRQLAERDKKNETEQEKERKKKLKQRWGSWG
jgi:hypothetical protein